MATALAAILIPAAVAAAEPAYYLSTSNSGSESGSTYAVIEGVPAEVTGPMRVVVRRGAAIVLDSTGDYYAEPGYAYSEVISEFQPLAGDSFELYNPAGSSSPVRTYRFTGSPRLESCPVGSQQFSGHADPDMQITRAFARRPSQGSGDPSAFNPATVTRSGDTYTAALQRPLGAEDTVFVSGQRIVDANFSVFHSESRKAGTCVPAGGGTTPPPPPPPPPPAAKLLNGVVEPLAGNDIKQGGNPAFVTVRVTCSAASTIPCAGTAGIQTVRTFAKPAAFTSAKARKKRITLATKRFSVAPGKTKVVRLKLTRDGMKLLRRQRTLKVRVSVVTKDAAGKRLGTSRTVTLKAKRRAARH
jgi:hypothetical protein